MTHLGELIELWRFSSNDSLDTLRSTRTFVCPHCLNPLILRLGIHKIPHFAHQSLALCDPNYESESTIHFNGKKIIFDRLKKEGRAVEMEKYFAEISQRADIFTSKNSVDFAVEFQCSSIRSTLMIKRSKGYKSIGVTPHWLLGPPLVKQFNCSKIRLSTYQTLFIKFHPLHGFYLLQLDPAKESILFFPHLIPISNSIFISKMYHFSICKYSFPFLPAFPVNHVPLKISDWLTIKEKLIVNLLKFNHRKKDPLLHELYEAGESIHLTPSYVGIPIKDGLVIANSFFYWQCYLWLDIFAQKQFEELISKKELVRAIDQRIKKGYLKTRNMPFIQGIMIESLINQYVEVLVKTDVLKKESEEIYSWNEREKLITKQEHQKNQKKFISKYEELLLDFSAN